MQVLDSVKFLSAVALGLVTFASLAQDSRSIFTPAELRWEPSPRVPGLESVNLIGDPTKPGPIVYRIRLPASFTVQPHTHPDDRTYTIISGTWYVGWGPKFDETKLQALPAGSFYTEPANVPHFVLTKGDGAVIQITATAPVAAPRFVDPAHAPKKRSER